MKPQAKLKWGLGVILGIGLVFALLLLLRRDRAAPSPANSPMAAAPSGSNANSAATAKMSMPSPKGASPRSGPLAPPRSTPPQNDPAEIDPFAGGPGQSPLERLIARSQLVAEAYRDQGPNRQLRSRVYRRPPGTPNRPLFRVVDEIQIGENGTRQVTRRVAMEAETALVRTAEGQSAAAVKSAIAATGAKLLRTSPNGDTFLLSFPGESPWAVDTALERLRRAGLSQSDPNLLIFPN